MYRAPSTQAEAAEGGQDWSNHLKRTSIWQLLVRPEHWNYKTLTINDKTDQGRSGRTGSAGPVKINGFRNSWVARIRKPFICETKCNVNDFTLLNQSRQESDTFGIFAAHWLWIKKLIWYFRSPWYAIVSNMTHFFIQFGMSDKKWPVFNYVFYLYWCKIYTFGIFRAGWHWMMGN